MEIETSRRWRIVPPFPNLEHRPGRDTKENPVRRTVSILAALAFLISLAAAPVAAGGPPSLSFYVDGARYRTVGTPTDFSNTGAPDFTYDRIYALGSGLINVAEAKPGDRDFNGGRWAVMPISWSVTPVQLTSAEQVEAYADAGWLAIGDEPVRLFFCSVNRVPPGHG
jgi:hypothetical protein